MFDFFCFAGILWTGLGLDEMLNLTGSDVHLMSKIAEGIGRFSLPELLAVSTFDDLTALAQKVLELMKEGEQRDAPTFSDLATLGTLALFIGDEFQSVAKRDFNRFMASLPDGRLGKCVCLPDHLRLPIATALVSHYG